MALYKYHNALRQIEKNDVILGTTHCKCGFMGGDWSGWLTNPFLGFKTGIYEINSVNIYEKNECEIEEFSFSVAQNLQKMLATSLPNVLHYLVSSFYLWCYKCCLSGLRASAFAIDYIN